MACLADGRMNGPLKPIMWVARMRVTDSEGARLVLELSLLDNHRDGALEQAAARCVKLGYTIVGSEIVPKSTSEDGTVVQHAPRWSGPTVAGTVVRAAAAALAAAVSKPEPFERAVFTPYKVYPTIEATRGEIP